MSLEEIGSIGEFVSGIGVVISLIYLAYQVRENSKFVKENSEFLRATHDVSSNNGVAQVRKNYFDHPELLDIESRGHRCQELDFNESAKYHLIVSGTFENHFTYFLQYKRGLTSDVVFDYWSSFFDDYCKHEGVKHWWRRFQNRFPDNFREYIDEKAA
ncbi:MAG: hypothetical protein ACJAYE_003468 [Candidatus Azotimanducaceae bacterium]|jgi:hypothetical protein